VWILSFIITTGIVLSGAAGTGRGTITARGASLNGTGYLGSSIICPLIIAMIIPGMIAFVMATSGRTGEDGSATDTGTHTTKTGDAVAMTVDAAMTGYAVARAVDAAMMGYAVARTVNAAMMVDTTRTVDEGKGISTITYSPL
jgi:hypothetical protein